MAITREELESILDKKLHPITQSMQFINDHYEQMVKTVAELQQTNTEIREENKILKSQVLSLSNDLKQQKTSLDEQEQYNRRDCLEIKGIPFQHEENANEIVKAVGSLVDVDISDEDISVCHRLPVNNRPNRGGGTHSPPKPPTLIVKFVRREVRDKLYKARIDLKGKSTRDLYRFEAGADNRIYIAESLTKKKKELFTACLTEKRNLKFMSIWSNYGRIYIRMSRETRPVYISSVSDLAKLKAYVE